jgi:hypothetical protein
MSPNRSPDRSDPRIAMSMRGIPALGLCAVAAVGWAEFSTRHPAEATAQMEQLARQIERAEVLHPDAARQLARVMDRPPYDCARIACDAALLARNVAARERLRRSIAGKLHPGNVARGDRAGN